MSEECMEKLCELKDALVDYTVEIVEDGFTEVDSHELGEVVDIIKDLYQAEKYCYEACYYKSAIEATNKAETGVIGHADCEISELPYITKSSLTTASDDAQKAMNTLKSIWGSASLDEKTKMKSDLNKLLGEMVN